MNKLTQYGLAGFLILGVSNTCMALTINEGTTEVGKLDTFVAAAKLPNAGEQTETDWVNTVLDSDLKFDIKTEDLLATNVDDNNGFLAVALDAGDDDFIIKNSTAWALFKNNESSTWAVIDTNAMIPFEIVTKDGSTFGNGAFSDIFNLSSEKLKISHISEFAGEVSVPEPSALALLGLGLVGIGFSGRKTRA